MGHQNSFMPSFGDGPLWADRDVVIWGLLCCCFGGPAGFPAQGLHSQWASVDGAFLFGLWSKCAHWKETGVHLRGCPQPGSKPGAQVSGTPLGGTETNRGTPSIIRWVVSEGGAAKAWVHSWLLRCWQHYLAKLHPRVFNCTVGFSVGCL